MKHNSNIHSLNTLYLQNSPQFIKTLSIYYFDWSLTLIPKTTLWGQIISPFCSEQSEGQRNKRLSPALTERAGRRLLRLLRHSFISPSCPHPGTMRVVACWWCICKVLFLWLWENLKTLSPFWFETLFTAGKELRPRLGVQPCDVPSGFASLAENSNNGQTG